MSVLQGALIGAAIAAGFVAFCMGVFWLIVTLGPVAGLLIGAAVFGAVAGAMEAD